MDVALKHERELEAKQAEAERVVAEVRALVETAQREMEGTKQETVAAKAKGRWGKMATARKGGAVQKKKEHFRSVVKELRDAKEQEERAKAAVAAAESVLAKVGAEERAAEAAEEAADDQCEKAEGAVEQAAAAVAEARRYEDEAEARYHKELAAAQEEFVAATDPAAKGRAQARFTRCKIVHDEEKKAGVKERASRKRGLAAATADLERAKGEQTASRELMEDALKHEIKALDAAKAEAEKKVAEAHALVQKVTREMASSKAEAEADDDGSEEAEEEEVCSHRRCASLFLLGPTPVSFIALRCNRRVTRWRRRTRRLSRRR